MTDSAHPPLVAADSSTSNLAQLITEQARQRPDVIALVEPGPERRTVTWSALEAKIDAVAAGLAAYGLVAGQRVGIRGPNSIEFVIAYFAALRAGFVAVPINPDAPARDIERIVADSGMRVLFTDPTGATTAVPEIELSPTGLRELAVRGAAPVDSPADAEALAVLLYTAGTSGTPKAAMLSHRALLAHLDQVAPAGVITEDTVALAMLPLFHVFGLNAVLGGWARAGARLVIVNGFDGFFDVIAAEGVTNLPVAPVVLSRVLTDERATELAETVTTVLSGAAPLSVELRSAFTARTGLRVDQGYGLTEAAPGVSVTFGTEEEHVEHGFVGRPLPGVEVRIGDGSDPAEPGEIWIRGANLFSGYWPDGSGGPDADGWFATGDIGYLDGAGQLFLVDRARELIIVNGFNVFPAEVEEAIGELDGVTAAAVVGRPDARTGEQIVAFVVGAVDVEAVARHCAGRLAKFKRPAVIQIVDELPRGATGKVQKGNLRLELDQQAARGEGAA